MSKSLFGLLCATGLFIASVLPPAAMAQQESFYNYQLYGTYGMQFTGSVNLPAPFNTLNGPFSRNGKVVFDGHGNLTATVIANYSGTISHDNFTGTYVVNSDGTFTLTIPNLPTPLFPPGTPNVFSFDGILVQGGLVGKITLDGVSVGGQAQTNIGSVIIGEIIKQ